MRDTDSDVVDVLPDYCFAYALVDQGFIRREERSSASLTARPVWEILAGWLTTIAFVSLAAALVYTVVAGGTRLLEGQRRLNTPEGLLRGVCATFGVVLLSMALRTYLGRFSLLYEDHTIFAGVGYTDAHVTINGLLIVAILLLVGAVVSFAGAFVAPRVTTLAAAIAPAIVGWIVQT